jgi:hypothetical protein
MLADRERSRTEEKKNNWLFISEERVCGRAVVGYGHKVVEYGQWFFHKDKVSLANDQA